MKINDLPDFAKKYKTKGYDVRYVNGTYVLFKVSSKRVPDKKYPVLVQEYIGIIDESKGLISKKTYQDNTSYLEYGLSNFIFKKLKRVLIRSMFCTDEKYGTNYIILAIVYFIFESISDISLASSFISFSRIDELKELRDNKQIFNEKRIDNLVNKIAKELQFLFNDDLNDICNLLKLVVVRSNVTFPNPIYNQDILTILEKHKVKL